MANSDYLGFLNDPDQDSRRAQLREFIGPNAESYLRTYDYIRAEALERKGGKVKFRLLGAGFVWAALFLGPVWFFYRKLWIWAWGIVALMLILPFIPGQMTSRIGTPLGIAMAISARRIYLYSALSKLQKISRSAPASDHAILSKDGGVSKRAGWISATIVVGVLLLTIYFLLQGDGAVLLNQ